MLFVPLKSTPGVTCACAPLPDKVGVEPLGVVVCGIDKGVAGALVGDADVVGQAEPIDGDYNGRQARPRHSRDVADVQPDVEPGVVAQQFKVEFVDRWRWRQINHHRSIG